MNRLQFAGIWRTRAFIALAVVLVVLVATSIARLVGYQAEPEPDATRVADFLSQPSVGGFRQVMPDYAIELPRDHGSHPEFRQEWWYFTGNLITENQRSFGYQLTFFRFGEASIASPPDSAWYAKDAWMAHFALTDVAGNRMYTAEDIARGALNLAGATAAPFSVWLHNWSVQSKPYSCGYCIDARLRADYGEVSVDLNIKSEEPPVLHGEQGYSVKNQQGSVASHYYSLPGMATTGYIRIGGETFPITGSTWMDREWSSAMLAKGQSGWDWFALRLNDGSSLMLFQVRQEDGAHFRSGTLIKDGQTVPLAAAGLRLTGEDHWRSPATGSAYPTQWQLESDQHGSRFQLRVTPLIENQEVNLSFRYYEGAVTVAGEFNGTPVEGKGYMELTGYE